MKSQIWIAVSVYVRVAIVRKRLDLSRSLYEIPQILSLNQFEKTLLDTLAFSILRGPGKRSNRQPADFVPNVGTAVRVMPMKASGLCISKLLTFNISASLPSLPGRRLRTAHPS